MKAPSLDSLMKSATDLAEQVKISTVLNCLLWALAPLLIALVVVSFNSNHAVQAFLMWATGADLAAILVSFVGILSMGTFKKPELLNLLRSEEHTYRMKVLETLGDQKHVFEIAAGGPAETNPALPPPQEVAISEPEETGISAERHE